MDFLTFVRSVRRHWIPVVVAVVLGAIAGFATTLVPSGSTPAAKVAARPTDYFAAKHVLALDDFTISASDAGESLGLDEIALLATGPDVVQRVATRLDTEPAAIANRIETTLGANQKLLTIRAVATSAEDAVRLVDAIPPELNAYLQERVQTRMGTERDALVKRLSDLRAQQRAFDTTLADPSLARDDRETTEAERDAVVNQYRLAYDRFTRLADSESVPEPLTTLDPGRAFPITRADYEATLARAATGDNHQQEATDPASAGTVDPASPSGSLEGPIPRSLLGALFGLCAALTYVAIRGRFDTRVRDRGIIEASLGAPVLADIPNMSRAEVRERAVLARDAPLSSTAEAYRSIRASLLLVKPELERRGSRGLVVMVASPKPSEGKTLSTANLAIAMAETGMSVLAVNCDFRRPVLASYFGIEPAPATVVASGIPRLSIVTNVARDPGANPARAVAAQRSLVDWARTRYDVVLLDTAPLLVTNDAVDLLSAADVVTVVVRHGSTKSGDLERASALLARHGARVVGAIANCVADVTSSYYYYYSPDIAKQLPHSGSSDTLPPPTGAPLSEPSQPSEPAARAKPSSLAPRFAAPPSDDPVGTSA